MRGGRLVFTPTGCEKRELADYFIHSYEDITNQTYEVL